MNKIILQLWEESERNWGVRPDGCSIHLDSDNRDNFVNDFYSSRDKSVPDVYERAFGEPFFAFVQDDLFKILEIDKSIRLLEHEFNNLVNLEEIIIKND
jgi:hypothetical protein